LIAIGKAMDSCSVRLIAYFFAFPMAIKPFDYTEWQRDLWKGKDIEEIHALATEYEKS
jgi:hypothetical protein